MKADNSSRGMRNNNPLNIRHGRSQWHGMAMACVECGLQPDFVAREPIAHGYQLAFGRRLAAVSF